MLRLTIRKDIYLDSVILMGISTKLRRIPGVDDAAVVMGTPPNLEWLADAGLLEKGRTPAIGSSDLVIAVRGSEEALNQALESLDALMPGKGNSDPRATGDRTTYRLISEAVREVPEANVALISVPGSYARPEAEEALRSGLHVMLFSDNVPLTDELALKQLAAQKGLLVMGPDCGTSIVNGVGLGFSNLVVRGDIGVVGASGTGIQETCCLLDAMGAGISHAIGTGSHDPSDEIGGLTFRAAVRALGSDSSTKVLLLLSKPSSERVTSEILVQAVSTGKPVVACFLGKPAASSIDPRIHVARTLADAALHAARLSLGEAPAYPLGEDSHSLDEVRRAIEKNGAVRGAVRGLFCGGTLCTEAQMILSGHLGEVRSNASLTPNLVWHPGIHTQGHLLIDLGDDYYTVGRPHPMMDGSERLRLLRAELEDEGTGVVLLDVILGSGAEADPAGPIAVALREGDRRPSVPVVVSFCGTSGDPQGFQSQWAALEEAGAYLFRSNATAAAAAAALSLGQPGILGTRGK